MTDHRRNNLSLIGVSASIAAFFAVMIGVQDGRTATGATAGITDPTIASQIDDLNDTIKDKRSSVDDLQKRIGAYKALIEKQQQEATSLADQIGLLENRMAQTRLSIEANEKEISLVNDEIKLLDAEIGAYEAQLDRDKLLMAEILRSIDSADGDVLLTAIFSSESIADLFDALQALASVNEELAGVLQRARATRDALVASRTQQEGRKARLNDLHVSLTLANRYLEEEKGAKETLLIASKDSEAQFRTLLADAREDEAAISQEIARLQGKIDAKISENDSVGDSSILSWPVDVTYKGISTLFHDPTYPFRHLFEHSGLDIPQKQGTPVGAAAPGYVAWTRVGSMYGNYVMVIHKNGYATLYAHLSKVSVKADQYVTRGQSIGLSGGMPGTAGAGLSTGPHLHFELRKNGVPVNPLPQMVTKP